MNREDQAFTIGGLELLASMVGQQNGIRVIFGGNSTCIDHSTTPMTIYFPGNLANTEANRLIITAKLYHEAAHARFTDFLVKNWNDLVNILEDVRIERLMGKRFIGCRQVLKQRWEVYSHTIAPPLADDGLLQNVHDMIWLGMRHEILDHPFGEQAAHAEQLVRHHIPGNVVDQVLTLSRSASLADGKNTQHVSDCVLAILKLLYEDQEASQSASSTDQKESNGQAQDNPPSSDGQDNDQSEASAGSTESEETASDTADDDSMGDSSNTASDETVDETDQAEGADADSQDGSESSSSASEETHQDGSPQASTADGQGDTTDGADGKSTSTSAETQSDGTDPSRTAAENTPMSGSGFSDEDSSDTDEPGWRTQLVDSQDMLRVIDAEAMIDGLLERSSNRQTSVNETPLAQVTTYAIDEIHSRTTSNQLRSQLQGLLQAIGYSQEYHVSQGGRLDSRCLHTLRTPNPKPFLREEEGAVLNTAIQFLIDASSSMSEHDRFMVANEAAYALSQSTFNIEGVSSATAYFRKSEVISVNGFDEKPSGRMFGVTPAGGTPIDMALHWCLHQLWPRDETRKIVIFLTDGQVGESTTDKIDFLKKHGIECYGIGLGADLSHILSAEKQASIYQTRELPKAMFGILRQALFNLK